MCMSSGSKIRNQRGVPGHHGKPEHFAAGKIIIDMLANHGDRTYTLQVSMQYWTTFMIVEIAQPSRNVHDLNEYVKG